VDPNGYKNTYKDVIEVDQTILTSFRPLIIGSTVSGYSLKFLFVSFGALAFLGTGFNTTNGLAVLLDSEALPFFIKLIPVFFSFLGLGLAFYLYISTNRLYNVTR